MIDVDELARSVLGIRLRPPQRAAVTAVAGGRDTLAVLPTGSGKSAIYQVAGCALGGLTVVVSPLVALQRDQVRSLVGHGLAATVLNAGLHPAERAAALTAIREGQMAFVLLGPEQLANAESLAAVTGSARPVTLVAVDEAHLIGQWGHDFRPDYLRLADVVDALGRPPVLALTATAAPPGQVDITRRLRMTDPMVIISGFDRPEIGLAVRRTRPGRAEDQAVDDATAAAVLAAETPALVYALTRARCTALAERLRRDAYRVEAYHAGIPAAGRTRVQDDFFAGRLDIVVATSAFGMGIDKPDIRTVVHAGAPGSLEEYYQEIGRAGRDGRPADAVLVHDPRTVRIPRSLAARNRLPAAAIEAVVARLNAADPNPADPNPADLVAADGTIGVARLAEVSGTGRNATQRVVAELLELSLLVPAGNGAVVAHAPLPGDAVARVTVAVDRRQEIRDGLIDAAQQYAGTTHCRRAELLAYFGEVYSPPCGNCDNDRVPKTPPPPRERPSFARPPGVPVEHGLWGPGVLVSRDQHELVTWFESTGYRHLTPSALSNGLLTLT